MTDFAVEVNTEVSRAALERLEAAGARICFACRTVSVHSLPGNGRDGHERVCPRCRAEAMLPVADAAREGWLQVTA